MNCSKNGGEKYVQASVPLSSSEIKMGRAWIQVRKDRRATRKASKGRAGANLCVNGRDAVNAGNKRESTSR